MSEFVTVARPTPKAAFDFAVEHQSVEALAGYAGVLPPKVTRTSKWQSFSLARWRRKRSLSRLSQSAVSS